VSLLLARLLRGADLCSKVRTSSSQLCSLVSDRLPEMKEVTLGPVGVRTSVPRRYVPYSAVRVVGGSQACPKDERIPVLGKQSVDSC